VSLNEADDQKPYDQFQGKKSTYRDDIYTTTLDHSKITSETKQFAERKEREILSQDSKGNVHLAEERQQRVQQDFEDGHDEEMKFSGVHRENGGFKKGTKLAPKETKVSKFKVGKKQEKTVTDIMFDKYLKSPPRDA